MPRTARLIPVTPPEIRVHSGADLGQHIERLEQYVAGDQVPLSYHPGWLAVLERGLNHTPYLLEAVEDEKTRGFLALAYMHSWLFGRFLVSLPYVNYGGVVADDARTTRLLIDRAVELAQSLDVRFLELRHEDAVEHAAITHVLNSKVHLRLVLAASPEEQWKQIPSKVRNQIRKGRKHDLRVLWGHEDLLDDFYAVFSQNMRDLGTPVFGRRLFASILRQFPARSELCVVRAGDRPVAAAILIHGWGVTEVTSASSLRGYNHTCANMLMYWHLLERSVQRGQKLFDFGRSSSDSSSYHFKTQWGAEPSAADWQYAVRVGDMHDMRPEHPRYQLLIRLWQRLPVWLTRLIGPRIVRGIP
jgi:FemAB-related protein (PEP-CTERM system-associated)